MENKFELVTEKDYIFKSHEIKEKYKNTGLKLRNIEYFLNDEDKDDSNKFDKFNQWCQKEGVVMPSIEYPAYFEGGLQGIKCTRDIQFR